MTFCLSVANAAVKGRNRGILQVNKKSLRWEQCPCSSLPFLWMGRWPTCPYCSQLWHKVKTDQQKHNVAIRIYSFDSFWVTFNVLLSPRFATEAQNNSVSNPAGHSYSNVSNTHVQNNHSLLATVKMRTAWICPGYCPNGIQSSILWPFSVHQGTVCIWWWGQLSSFDTTDANIKAYVLGSSTISGEFAESSCSIICV